jgi:AAA domain
MSDELYRAIARATSGFVEAPAGCGKTEAIARTVGGFCEGRQLVLTHTNAGVDALTRRFRSLHVPASKYHVDTIAGWCWGWVRRYPSNGEYPGSPGIAVWPDVYPAMNNLLKKDFVRKGVLNSYTGLIVDEYQDCTVAMHKLVASLKGLLPCRVLGDDLQGIFDFGGQDPVSWADVKAEFGNDLGALQTPHRWNKVNNHALGEWLLGARPDFRQQREPSYKGSPVERRTVTYAKVASELIGLTHAKEGRICVIGPKQRPLASATETTLVKNGYRVLEPNELSALRALIVALVDGTSGEKAVAVTKFLFRAHGGLPANEKDFVEKLCAANSQQPRKADKKALCQKHASGVTPAMLTDVLAYIGKIDGASCKLKQSMTALKSVLEQHVETGDDLKTLYADEVAKRKHHSRSNVFRAVGTTLLVKGLEFDHAIILRDGNWLKNWGGYNDLYVALTRGARSVTLLELAN